jgi:hypothetical protein
MTGQSFEDNYGQSSRRINIYIEYNHSEGEYKY